MAAVTTSANLDDMVGATPVIERAEPSHAKEHNAEAPEVDHAAPALRSPAAHKTGDHRFGINGSPGAPSGGLAVGRCGGPVMQRSRHPMGWWSSCPTGPQPSTLAAPWFNSLPVERFGGPVMRRSGGLAVQRSDGPTVQQSGGPVVQQLTLRSPAEPLNQKASVFFYRSAPAAPSAFFAVLHPRYFQHRFGQKKKLVENSLFAIRFLSVFFDVFHAHFSGFMVICRLDPKMESKIQHMNPVVFGQHAVIVDCCCLVVIGARVRGMQCLRRDRRLRLTSLFSCKR